MASRKTKPASVHECAWCGRRKPIQEMRHPDSSRGPTPTTCHACREAHPDLGWCDFHEAAHPKDWFQKHRTRPIGIYNKCKDAQAYLIAKRRAKPHRWCPGCESERESWDFRGGRFKRAICRYCQDARPSESWCVDCNQWLPLDAFYRTGTDGKYATTRCKMCRSTASHGVTQTFMRELTGGAPKCGACGSTESLKVDHSHDHCPAQRGCRDCVRGWLCHGCNTAEGLLQTAARARLLAEYMERHFLVSPDSPQSIRES